LGTRQLVPGSSTSAARGQQIIVLQHEAADIARQVKFTLSAEFCGQPYSYTWTAKADGQKYPVEGQSSAQSIEFQRPSERHVVTIHFRDGQEVARHDSTISPDGNVMTTKSRTKNRAGVVAEIEAKY